MQGLMLSPEQGRVSRDRDGGEENVFSFKEFNTNIPVSALCQAPAVHQVLLNARTTSLHIIFTTSRNEGLLALMTDENNGAESGEVICPRSHGW